MRQKGLVFEAGDLIRDKQGTKVTFEIEEKLKMDFGDEAKPVSPLCAKVVFMKLDCGVNVHIKDMNVKFEFMCNKCDKNYTQDIAVKETERVYYIEKQRGVNDFFDVYYIDMKNMRIDISEVVRQEIILHFPTIPVCSKSCKGLCPSCGVDLNDTSCRCKPFEPEQNKPLAILKKLYNVKASSTQEKDLQGQNKTQIQRIRKKDSR